MYAVFVDGKVVYVGGDLTRATEILGANPGASMIKVSSLEDLAARLAVEERRNQTGSASGLSQAAVRVLQILDDAVDVPVLMGLGRLVKARAFLGRGINSENAQKVADVVQERSKKVVAEVKNLGIEGMKTVGDSFVALGELLRKGGDKEE